MRVRDPLATHNERVKLRAGFLNALALGFLGFALLRPLIEGTLSFTLLTVAFLVTGLALHSAAQLYPWVPREGGVTTWKA